MNEDVSKILTVPVNGGMDAASMMAMQQNSMFNNPWAYLILLSIFQNGGFGNRFGNGGGPGVGGAVAGGVIASDVDAKLNALANQISQNQSTDSILSAIQGNAFAQSQLAQDININRSTLVEAINGVNMAIAQVGASTGLGLAGVQNAVANGNLNIIQNLKDCCCTIRTEALSQGYENRLQTVEQTNILGSSITNQGYENQIRTINQTQDILTGVRAENTLTRASIDAFRTAWEQGRYADLLQQNNALQDRLNVLEIQAAGTAAVANAVAPIQAQVNNIAAHQLPTYPQAFVPGYPILYRNPVNTADTTNS